MKRIVALFLAVIMICSFTNVVFAISNDAILSCSVSETQLSPGDELTVTVSLANSPNAKSVALVFNYDVTDTFMLISGEWKLTGALLANFDSKTTACGTAAIAYMSPANVNGNIFKLKLKVKDSAPSGEKTISVSPVIKNDATSITCADTAINVQIQTDTACNHTNKTLVNEQPSTTDTQGWDTYYVCHDCGQLFASNGTTEISDIPYRPLLTENGVVLSCKTETTDIHPGDEVEIILSLKNSPNAKSIALVFNYDVTDTFTLIGGEWMLTGALLANFDSKTTACGTAAIAYMSPADVNGNIFKLKLKVKETADLGDAEIVVSPVIKNDATTIDCNNASITLTIAEFACQHTTKVHIAAKASSCKEQGWDEYYYCSDCNQLFAADGVKEISEVPFRPFSGHTGGEATCKSLAVCTVCGQSYGNLDPDNHKGSTYKVNQKEATCYEEGYTGDTYCSDCNAKLSSGTVIQKNAHNPASTWSTDEDYHWHDCQTVGCGNLIDKAAHSGGEATCIHKAVCSVCNVEYGSLDSNNHKNTEIRNTKAATCCEDGYTGDTYCKDCNAKIASGSVIPATGNHVDADGLWETDGTQHWHTCSYGTKFDVTSHSGGTATCKDKAVCTVCGESYGDVDTTNHVGETEIRNIANATCCEDGYTGDTYCKDCNTKISNGTTIPATGNHVDADGLWETDGTQHWHTCSYGTKFDITSHSGGTATCKDRAICSVCGISYGELNANNHTGTTYILNQKEATCFEEGYTGDTYCSDCNVKLSSGTVIEKNTHNPASTWSTDADYHWHDCQTIGCGNLIDKAPHTGGEATCINKAVCSVCHVQYGLVNPNNHKNTEIRDQKDATCCEDGYTGDTYCKDCNVKIASGEIILASGNHVDVDGNWETDGSHHWHTCSYGTKFDVTAHSGGTATCKDKAICSVCGTSYGDFDSTNHIGGTEIRDDVIPSCNTDGYTGDTYCLGCGVKMASGTIIPATGDHVDADGNWETDSTKHWHTCSCGTKFDITSHSGGTATCKNKAVCSVCGVAYGELDAHNHIGSTYKLNQKEATCYEEGYTGDIYCSDCNAKLSSGTVIEKNAHNPASTWSTDADYHWHDCQTIGCGNLIDKAAHSGGEATCIHKAICSVCNVEYGSLNYNNHKNTEIRNIKAVTCCEDGYTGDTYCKDCNTKIATGTTIPATGNHVDADGNWETDGTQHWHTCSYGTKFDVTAHSGGTATCKDKAICSACGTSYGELNPNNHIGTTYKLNQKEATCYEEGYTGDTYCSDCNAKLSSGTVIEKNAHNPASTWSTDADYHWHDCQTVGCGNLIDKAAHTGGEATCIHKAVCSVCNAEYGSLNPSNHKNTEIRNAKAATCCEDGYTGDTYCKDCNKKIASGATIPATGNHIDADGLWETDGTAHWHTCSYGTKFDVTSHSGGTATCKDKAVCLVCGVAYGELDASNHVGGTEIRDAVAVSCEVDGYTGDTYCKGCGEKLATGQSIPKTSHNITKWTVTKKATTSESGEKTGKCTSCGQEFKAEIAKLSSNPIAKENTEYKGMNTAPQLEPEGQTVLPADIIFVAERIEQENLSTEQKTYAAKAIEEVNKNLSTIVGNGKKAESIDVICVLDLSLLIHNYDAASGEDLGYEEYHFDGSVKVTVEIPEEMKSAKNPRLIHIKDDNTCEIVPFTDNDDGTISFVATGFSNYVLLDVETSNIQTNGNGETTSPKTGDNSNMKLWIILFAVSAFGLVLTTFGKKKRVK